MKSVKLITDGSCLGNPGPGGWAAILRSGSHKREISGSHPATTNNRMELMGAIMALESLKDFSNTYQAATDQPLPLFRRRA